MEHNNNLGSATIEAIAPRQEIELIQEFESLGIELEMLDFTKKGFFGKLRNLHSKRQTLVDEYRDMVEKLEDIAKYGCVIKGNSQSDVMMVSM